MPEQQPGVDRVVSVVEGAAQVALQGLVDAGAELRPQSRVLSGAGWTVLVCASPTPAPARVPGLSPTEVAILETLAQARGQRIPASRLLTELSRDGHIHSEITVKRALARLKGLGLIGNSRRRPRGYFLTGEAPPLFRSVK